MTQNIIELVKELRIYIEVMEIVMPKIVHTIKALKDITDEMDN